MVRGCENEVDLAGCLEDESCIICKKNECNDQTGTDSIKCVQCDDCEKNYGEIVECITKWGSDSCFTKVTDDGIIKKGCFSNEVCIDDCVSCFSDECNSGLYCHKCSSSNSNIDCILEQVSGSAFELCDAGQVCGHTIGN